MLGPSPVVLWKTDTISCICLSHTPNRVEVRLSVKDVVIQRELFTDQETAAQFALDKMRAYNAS
jgi:hypothetical protein